MQEEISAQPPELAPPPRRKSARATVIVALLAFLVGAGLVGWLAHRGDLDLLLSRPDDASEAGQPVVPRSAAIASLPNGQASDMAAIGTVEGRVALLEERFSRLTSQAEAARGNAARAENLLTAFAVRRMCDRGKPLGYLEDQLRLRFSEAQPQAVETIVSFAQDPVTLDELGARLDAIADELTDKPLDEGVWSRVQREVASMFVIRRQSAPRISAQARLERAQLMLTAGRIDAVIGEIRRLPGASAGRDWIADAERYGAVQHALDLIETSAMIEPPTPRGKPDDAKEEATPAPAPSAVPSAAAPKVS